MKLVENKSHSSWFSYEMMISDREFRAEILLRKENCISYKMSKAAIDRAITLRDGRGFKFPEYL